jgi:hypothetical protein
VLQLKFWRLSLAADLHGRPTEAIPGMVGEDSNDALETVSILD